MDTLDRGVRMSTCRPPSGSRPVVGIFEIQTERFDFRSVEYAREFSIIPMETFYFIVYE